MYMLILHRMRLYMLTAGVVLKEQKSHKKKKIHSGSRKLSRHRCRFVLVGWNEYEDVLPTYLFESVLYI